MAHFQFRCKTYKQIKARDVETYVYCPVECTLQLKIIFGKSFQILFRYINTTKLNEKSFLYCGCGDSRPSAALQLPKCGQAGVQILIVYRQIYRYYVAIQLIDLYISVQPKLNGALAIKGNKAPSRHTCLRPQPELPRLLRRCDQHVRRNRSYDLRL